MGLEVWLVQNRAGWPEAHGLAPGKSRKRLRNTAGQPVSTGWMGIAFSLTFERNPPACVCAHQSLPPVKRTPTDEREMGR